MASLPFADVEALGAWVGESPLPDLARAEAVLTAASALIVSELGSDVTEAWDSPPTDVAVVTVQAAARVWFNPQGVSSESLDDFARSWDSVSESGVYLTENERDILSRYRKKPKGLWTLGTTRNDQYEDQYLDVVGQPNEPMPFLPPGQ